jgi:DNA-binding LacI/PurR family transcriptional regulator
MSDSDRDEQRADTQAADHAMAARRPPTSADVARRAGVSRATVSYVLNDLPHSRVSEETRARVRAAAAELGYTPHAMARSLRAGHSDIVLLPQIALPTGPMVTGFYEGLAAQLGALGYTFIVHLDPSTRGVEAARVWASLRPAGLLVEAERVTRRSIELLRIAGTRAIMVLSEAPSRLAPTLVINEDDVGACAAAHLIARGHRHLVAVVPREVALLRLGIERLSGIKRVACPHGLTVERADLAYDEADAARLAAHWKEARPPMGVFTYNDEYGMLLMRALLDAGFAIPGDIALVGADNLPLCALLRPRLTSVHKGDAAAIGSVVETFHTLIQGQTIDLAAIPLFRPSIVVRESA